MYCLELTFGLSTLIHSPIFEKRKKKPSDFRHCSLIYFHIILIFIMETEHLNASHFHQNMEWTEHLYSMILQKI